MISRQNRFHGHASLRFVHQNGKTARGPFFLLKSATNPRRSNYRLAVVVSRKVHKSAVARNRIRRRLYAAVIPLENDINQPWDIVINVYDAKFSDEPPKELVRLVKKQFIAAGIITGPATKPSDD